jgi:hypothetical protein
MGNWGVSRLACSVIGVLLLGLVGCVQSVEPILKDNQVVKDDHLLGRWNSTENEKEYIEVAAGDQNTYTAVYHDKDGKTGNFVVRLGKVGGITLAETLPQPPDLQATDVYKGQLLPLYSFFWVTQTDPELKMRVMSSDWLKKYVEDHKDELRISQRKDTVIITASTEEIQAFILKHRDEKEVFGEEGRYVRPAADKK